MEPWSLHKEESLTFKGIRCSLTNIQDEIERLKESATPCQIEHLEVLSNLLCKAGFARQYKLCKS